MFLPIHLSLSGIRLEQAQVLLALLHQGLQVLLAGVQLVKDHPGPLRLCRLAVVISTPAARLDPSEGGGSGSKRATGERVC